MIKNIKTIFTFIHLAFLAHHDSPLILRELFGVEDDLFTKWETMGETQNLQESHGHLVHPQNFNMEPPYYGSIFGILLPFELRK